MIILLQKIKKDAVSDFIIGGKNAYKKITEIGGDYYYSNDLERHIEMQKNISIKVFKIIQDILPEENLRQIVSPNISTAQESNSISPATETKGISIINTENLFKNEVSPKTNLKTLLKPKLKLTPVSKLNTNQQILDRQIEKLVYPLLGDGHEKYYKINIEKIRNN